MEIMHDRWGDADECYGRERRDPIFCGSNFLRDRDKIDEMTAVLPEYYRHYIRRFCVLVVVGM